MAESLRYAFHRNKPGQPGAPTLHEVGCVDPDDCVTPATLAEGTPAGRVRSRAPTGGTPTARPGGADRFGEYLVHERLAVSARAMVHRAETEVFAGVSRTVALKRLLPHLAEDEASVRAFIREAKLATMMQHANIAAVHELGREGSTHFMAMEYVDGYPLDRAMRAARKGGHLVPVEVVVAILIQLADALDHAHTRVDELGQLAGFVHRDVAPGNVMLARDGLVKIIDFGVARTQRLSTRNEHVRGDFGYLAPEVTLGDDADARADLFSVGVIAHELLTARSLFASRDDYRTLLNVQRADPIAPSTVNPGVSAALDAIVLRALSRERERRYPSAAALRADLLALRVAGATTGGHAIVGSWARAMFASPPRPVLDAAWQPVGYLPEPRRAPTGTQPPPLQRARREPARAIPAPDVPAPAAPALERFGKFTVLGVLGRGGMAEALKCRLPGPEGAGEVVVVKRVLPELSCDPAFIDMFLDEARLAAGFAHPNVVRVFEIDHVDDVPYIAMEYVDGLTLAGVIRNAARAQQRHFGHAAHVIAGIAAGLHYAHTTVAPDGSPLRFIHRDVSPGNIMVSLDGIPKVLDFGIAKAEGRMASTEVGMIKGKLRYMSPEQATGKRLDPRTDVFSLGVCLYEATTFRSPFGKGPLTDASTLHALLAGRYPKPSEIVADYPRELEDIVMWALEPDVARRCPSAEALHARLARFHTRCAYASTRGDLARWVAELQAFGVRNPTGSRPSVRGATGPAPMPAPVPVPAVVAARPVAAAPVAPRAPRRHRLVFAAALLAIAVVIAMLYRTWLAAPVAPAAQPRAAAGAGGGRYAIAARCAVSLSEWMRQWPSASPPRCSRCEIEALSASRKTRCGPRGLPRPQTWANAWNSAMPWVTTTTRPPAWVARISSIAAPTRANTVSTVSPRPGASA